MVRIASIVLVTSLAALGLAGCANQGGSAETAAAPAAPAQKAAPAQPAPAKPAPPPASAAPAGSKLAKVQVNMHPGQVIEIMGQPTSQNTRITGKDFIPGYAGSDGARQYWNYKGQGRVVMGTNRWTGKQKVIAVEYDPSEDGY
jgi:hypothetical protein